MKLVAIVLFVILTIIAIIHAYWAFGGRWPGHDEESLVKTVVGTKGATKMPPFWITMLVVPLIFAAGYFPLIWVGLAPLFLPELFNWMAKIVLALIFLGRGIFSYTPFAAKLVFEEPFATMDKTYYAPLCLALGLGFVSLLLTT